MIDTCSTINFLVSVVREMSKEERHQIVLSELDDRYRHIIDTCSIINFLVSVVPEMSEEERE